jgi:hypothetical protein
VSSIYTNTAPITQGVDKNGCWAASFAWWCQAVLQRDVTFEDALQMYARWSVDLSNDESENYGALTQWGVRIMFNDNRFPVIGEVTDSSKLRVDQIRRLFDRGPILIAYFEPYVNGYHMNVLVAPLNSANTVGEMIVMDPSYNTFQNRNLNYYKKYTKEIFLGYRMNQAAPVPQYAYESSY